jgi:hypothetical protein
MGTDRAPGGLAAAWLPAGGSFMRRLLVAGAVTVLGVGTAALAVPSSAAGPHGVGCQLTGVAKIKPGLSPSPATMTYTFTGKLSNCNSSDSKLTGGKVSAKGKGSLSCAGGTSAGLAKVVWNTHKKSVLAYNTRGLANGDQLDFTTKSSSESALAKGDQGAGGLAFTSFTGDCVRTRVTRADFSGITLAGSPS